MWSLCSGTTLAKTETSSTRRSRSSRDMRARSAGDDTAFDRMPSPEQYAAVTGWSARDHHRPDAGAPARRDSLLDLGARRIDQAHQTDEHEVSPMLAHFRRWSDSHCGAAKRHAEARAYRSAPISPLALAMRWPPSPVQGHRLAAIPHPRADLEKTVHAALVKAMGAPESRSAHLPIQSGAVRDR